jgi:glycosyltransferase involved in cell wall biosynthesis
MKIWFTEIGEPLPIEKDVRLHRYGMFTKVLAALGHDVVWWTSSFSHAVKKNVYHENGDLVVNGVTLRILKGPGYRKNVSYQRIVHQRHFARQFSQKATDYPLPEIIISPVPTLETAEAAVRLGITYHVPVLVDIRDEWPDEFVNLAPPSLRWFLRLILQGSFKRMSYLCKNATGIIAMSRRQLDYGLSFAARPEGKFDGIFPHGYSAQKIDGEKLAAARKWWKEQGVEEDAFVCCFFGTIGRFFNLETVIESVKILSMAFKIQVVLCGDGSSLDHYKKLAVGMNTVIFPGWVDAPKIATLMEISHVGLAPYAANTCMSLPNKPFEYFAGGLPVVSSIQGELKQILADNDCGRTYDADSIDELCNILQELHDSEPRRKEMGRQARQVFEREFSVERISKKLEEHLAMVIENYGK